MRGVVWTGGGGFWGFGSGMSPWKGIIQFVDVRCAIVYHFWRRNVQIDVGHVQIFAVLHESDEFQRNEHAGLVETSAPTGVGEVPYFR